MRHLLKSKTVRLSAPWAKAPSTPTGKADHTSRSKAKSILDHNKRYLGNAISSVLDRIVWLNSEGSVPLWEAVLGKHDAVVKLLRDNGADLSAGDVGLFACIAAEQNSLELLKEIIRHRGDVTLPNKDGNTALHLAVCEGNHQMVEFLLKQGADIDKPNHHGWTPRNLAEQQGHEEIQALFEAKKACQNSSTINNSTPVPRPMGRFSSEPVIPHVSHEGTPLYGDGSLEKDHPRRKSSDFHNSLFGVISAANVGRKTVLFSSIGPPRSMKFSGGAPNYPHTSQLRITISCPEKGDIAGKLVLLPLSLKELLDIGAKKFDFLPTKVLTKDGAEVDDVKVVRDGDHLVLVGDGWMRQRNPQEAGYT
ncbi:putative Potassium channel AKT1 [Cocos nucifera]|nr:putative Potassium channel AKT1 [Cocos nucifera]